MATHILGPLHASGRHIGASPKTEHFLSSIPLQIVEMESLHNLWYLGRNQSYFSNQVAATTVLNEPIQMTAGNGSKTSGNVDADATSGGVTWLTASADDAEVMAVGIGGTGALAGNWSPAARRPIYFYAEWRFDSSNGSPTLAMLHHYVGLCNIGTLSTAGPLIGGTGAEGTRDHIGLYWQGNATPTVKLVAGNAAIDASPTTIAAPVALDTPMQMFLKIDYDTNSIQYYIRVSGSTAITGRKVCAAALSAITNMNPCFAVQVSDATPSVASITIHRAWCYQEGDPGTAYTFMGLHDD